MSTEQLPSSSPAADREICGASPTWTDSPEFSLASDSRIGEAVLHHVLPIKDIAQVDDDRAGHDLPQALQIELAGLLPFGGDHQCIRVIGAGIGAEGPG